MAARRVKVTLLTGVDVVTGYSPRLSGELVSLRYVKPGAASYTDGVDTVITKESDGEAVLTATNHNSSATFYPLAATHDITGAAALRVATGLPLLGPIVLANDRLKFIVADGGTAKTGDWYVTVK